MTTIKNPKSLRWLCALFAVVACSALAWSVNESRAGDGSWTCYVSDRFPDMEDAANWKGSVQVAAGLNKVASHVPAGAILVLELPVRKSGWGNMGGSYSEGAPSVVCIK